MKQQRLLPFDHCLRAFLLRHPRALAKEGLLKLKAMGPPEIKKNLNSVADVKQAT